MRYATTIVSNLQKPYSAARVVFSLALTSCALFGQAASPVLVRLSASATDASGQPATDLTADDFKVTDQGKPGRIVLFRRIDSAGWAMPAQPPEYTNRGAGGPPYTTVILLDLMNQSQADRLDAARTLGRSLAQLEAGDSVYLYLLTLEGTVEPLHAMGGKSGDDHNWTQQIEKTLDKAVKSASHARPAGMGQEDVVKKTYVALETLANQMVAMPGRRDIVWVTGGVPNVYPTNATCSGDWIDCALYVPHLSVTLDRDSTAVNPLSYSGNLNADRTRDMEDMAGLTGGRAFFRDDVKAVIAQLGKEAANYYPVAYDPGADNWDNKFHKVRLTCEKKGLKVQAKQRYYAYPDQRPPAARQQAALAAAYQSPVDNPEIGLRMAVTDAGAGKGLHLAIRINAADIVLREQGGNFDGAITLLISDIGAAGPIGDPMLSNSNPHLTREQHDAAVKDGLPMVVDHPVKEGTQKVRILLLDQTTNAIGSLTAPVR